MYTLTTYIAQSYEMYTLKDPTTASWLSICPRRGGLVTNLGIKGKELLYLNKDTLYDESKEIRGGIPVLFPICGQLQEQKYQWNGTTYSLPNHGLALSRPWDVVDYDCAESEAWITLKFDSNSETKKVYPFTFELLFTYIITKDKLTIKQEYRNHSSKQMPFYSGLHPYFKTDNKQFFVDSKATRYIDYNDLQVKDFTGHVDMSGVKKAFVLTDGDNKIVANLNSSTRIMMEASQQFKYWVLWTKPLEDFICVEPWMADRYELNRKEKLVMVKANGKMEAFVEIKLKR